MNAPDAQRFSQSRIFKSAQPLKGVVELDRQRLSILPTRRGFGFASTILLLLLTAFIYNNNLLYLLAFLLLSLFLVTILHVYQSLSGLNVQAGTILPVFVGDTAWLPLTVNNRSALPRLALRAVMAEALEFDVAPHQQKTVMLPVVACRRGWQTIGSITLDSCYPLGLFRVWSSLCFDRQLIAYPKAAAVAPPLPFDDGHAMPGRQTGQLTGDNDYTGIRAHQAGDSIRTIHWKAYAKGQGLFIKQFSAGTGGGRIMARLRQDYRGISRGKTRSTVPLGHRCGTGGVALRVKVARPGNRDR